MVFRCCLTNQAHGLPKVLGMSLAIPLFFASAIRAYIFSSNMEERLPGGKHCCRQQGKGNIVNSKWKQERGFDFEGILK